MYSMVMMAVMTTSTDTAQFNGYFRDRWFGRGCYGESRSESAGCYGSCHGFGSRVRAFFSFNGGCYGSSYGSCTGRSNGCYGSDRDPRDARVSTPPQPNLGGAYAAPYACFGHSAPSYSCGGGYASPAYSCFGSSMAPTEYFPNYGTPFATPTPAYFGGVTNTPDCYSGMSSSSTPIYGGSYPSTPIYGGSTIPNGPIHGNPADLPGTYPAPMSAPSSPFATPIPIDPPHVMESRSQSKNVLPPPGGPVSNRATVVVRVPTDAKLYAEGQLLQLTSAERSFVTPELPSGREYSYTFRIEYDRGGRTLSESQKVNVTAGKTVAVVFDDLSLGVRSKLGPTAVAKAEEPAKPVSAEKLRSGNPFRDPNKPTAISMIPTEPAPARITIKVPANAVLYIDGVKNTRTEAEREFNTPPLPRGREFSYQLKLEMVRDGRPEQIMQKLVFRAGETVPVDFTTSTPERNAAK